ncbi:MAG: helix-turn-helix domain-containing protein [Chitinivibrionales bacterium]|nr:helix-turn-helix domain-containing protein [Chitinivibrionales bacterium]
MCILLMNKEGTCMKFTLIVLLSALLVNARESINVGDTAAVSENSPVASGDSLLKNSIAAGAVVPLQGDSAGRDSGIAAQPDTASVSGMESIDAVGSAAAETKDSLESAGAITIIDQPAQNARRQFVRRGIARIASSAKSIPLLRWVAGHWRQVLVLIVSVFIIWVAVAFYSNKVEQRQFITSTRLAIMDKEVRHVCKYVEKECADPNLCGEAICEALTTGMAFLEALLRKELGMSVEELIRYVRINKARNMLEKNPHLGPEDIFEQAGYTDIELFMEDFANTAGFSFDELKKAKLHV